MSTSPTPTAPAPVVDPDELARVGTVARTLDKAARAHQLYDGTGPSYDRFVETLRTAFQAIWDHARPLTLEVNESRLLWQGCPVLEGQHRPGDLAFLFYRDGIRELIFRPGFEDTELTVFLTLIAGAQRLRNDQDDLITLFWEHDFEHFVYRHVDAAVDGPEIFAREPARPRPVDAGRLRSEIEEFRSRSVGPGHSYATAAANDATIAEPAVGPALLDPAELKWIGDELRRESERDLMRDVLHALLDRLQDGTLERQQRVIAILAGLLPGLISGGRFRDATLVLQELKDAAADRAQLPEAVHSSIDRLFGRLAEAETIQEMVRTVEDAPSSIRVDECAGLLRYFPTAALEPLLIAAESTPSAEVRSTLLGVAEHLTADDPRRLVAMLAAESSLLAGAAARLVGRMGVATAAPAVGRLLERPEPAVRLAAIAVLQQLRVPSAAGALQNVLEDPDREVRMAAARALAELGHAAARPRLEALIQSRRVREADISERIAFFEAYGCVAGREGVELLGRLLNGRSWLGRKEPAEVRASAALALGRIGHPDARQALSEAAQDVEVVVRTAVLRSLRREAR